VHRFLTARLVRPGRILPNRLFRITVVPLNWLIGTGCTLLNRPFVANVVALDRLAGAMPALLRVLIAIRINLVGWGILTRVILLRLRIMPSTYRRNLLVLPRSVPRRSFIGKLFVLVDCRRSVSASACRPNSTGAVSTTGVLHVLRRVRIQFVSTLQLAIVFDAFSFHGFFAFCRLRVQLLGLCRLTISLGSTSVSLSLCALCLCSLLLDFGLSSTNIMFGFGGLLPNLCSLLPLVLALLRCRLAADCDDDPDDDQNHDDGDDNPDDG